MKLLRSAALAVALLAIPVTGGCAVVAKLAPAVGTKSVAASTLDDRALAEAESAYNVVLHTYNVARAGGHITPAQHAKVRPWIVKARAVRKAAEAAYDAGNASDLNTQLAALKAALAQIKTLTPGA